MLNYAQQWAMDLLETIIQGVLCSPFITNNVRWLNAKTFHFTQMTVGGFKNHSRAGGWNRGSFEQTDVPFTLYHDRDVEFFVDKADVDETNKTASIQKITQQFLDLNAKPEIDAEFFSKVYTVAKAASLASASPIAGWNVGNVYTRICAMVAQGGLRKYRQRGSLICYISSELMDLLERSTEFTRTINMETIADGGMGIKSRVTEINGMPVIEVIDQERFYTAFDWAPVGTSGFGFEPASGAKGLNVVIASAETTKVVPKINSVYMFEPGQHTQGDGYLYQNRAFSGTFVFPNGKDGVVDSVFVDVNHTELP